VTWRRVGALGLAGLLCLAGCAGLPAPTVAETEGLFRTGTIEDAARAVRFPVARASYLPDGAKVVAVEFSARSADPWVVQRYELGGRIFYIKSEPPPRGLAPARDHVEVVQGRPAPLSARRGVDGGIAEWLLYDRRYNVLHTFGGEIAPEELVRIAAGSR
jgi:hypothetical protein